MGIIREHCQERTWMVAQLWRENKVEIEREKKKKNGRGEGSNRWKFFSYLFV